MHNALAVLWHPHDTNAGATGLDCVVYMGGVGDLVWLALLGEASRAVRGHRIMRLREEVFSDK